ncbi:MAG: hypothetical protein ACREXS_05175 [Gammaproteobacteria bacterium]
MILFSIFNNWMDLTRGPLGIPGIPLPMIFGWTIESQIGLVGPIAVLAATKYSPIHWGKNTLAFKVTAFAVSAALHHLRLLSRIYG